MEEVSPQARDLLDKINRQFTECNALYHAVAQQCGLSDAAFWTLYALYMNVEPQTQNRIAAEFGLPKQTLNSAVAAMAKKGLVTLCPGKGTHRGKIVALTDAGRALADATVGQVILAEQKAITDMGLAECETYYKLGQRQMVCLRREFEKMTLQNPTGTQNQE